MRSLSTIIFALSAFLFTCSYADARPMFGRGNEPSKTTAFVSSNRLSNNHHITDMRGHKTRQQQRHLQQRIHWNTKMAASDDGDGNVGDEEDPNANADDPDGVPILDSNEMRGGATFLGLEPREDYGSDPLDNGLQFTGPIILMISVYVTLSLFFPEDMPVLDL